MLLRAVWDFVCATSTQYCMQGRNGKERGERQVLIKMIGKK